MRPQPFGSAGSRQLRDGVCDAFELPFALWAPRRDASRGARWAGPLLGWSTERPPSRRDAEGDVSGQPRHAVASAHGTVRVREQLIRTQAETGQPARYARARYDSATPAAEHHSHQRASNKQPPATTHRKIKPKPTMGKYTASDGKEFDTKREWRKYEMLLMYTFRGTSRPSSP